MIWNLGLELLVCIQLCRSRAASHLCRPRVYSCWWRMPLYFKGHRHLQSRLRGGQAASRWCKFLAATCWCRHRVCACWWSIGTLASCCCWCQAESCWCRGHTASCWCRGRGFACCWSMAGTCGLFCTWWSLLCLLVAVSLVWFASEAAWVSWLVGWFCI